MPEIGIGRIVHYVLGDGRSKGQSRPAQVTSVFPQSEGPPLINCVVTLDGSNDGTHEGGHAHLRQFDEEAQVYRLSGSEPTEGPAALHVWRTSIPHAEAVGSPPTFPPATWHWPPGVS